MPKIPTMLHAAGDYANGALLLAAPRVLPIRDRRAQALAIGAGAKILTLSAFTDYELGIRRRIPMPVHLLVDAVAGGLMIAAGVGLRGQKGTKLPDWLPFVVVGAGEIAAAGLTERAPKRRRRQPDPDAAAVAPPSVPSPAPGISAGAPAAAAPPVAPPPLETPGPSVTPPAQPESGTERRERIEANLAGDELSQTGDDLVAREEAAAAAEAAGIGGSVPHDSDDPAMDPVLQAGGGEQDGWEMAEAELIENATHGDGGGQPERDAFTPEAESDRVTAVYGEADEIPVSEVVEDPPTSRQDPGQGPGLAADR
ncbi:MAG TPA: hypothetical protein VLP43_07710 [Solirubrobacteraceae bacterium]|nr:hypothetical protein [Solirubrobacteraceae bacterium]